MNNISLVELVPDAHLLLSSLRSVGYRPETAIADIVDNCISADASTVEISFVWDGVNSQIIIIDNGIGMTQEKLIRSMKIGSASPSDIRHGNDLGRFGMGMKTAAFSMGKKLTVVSKLEIVFANACWDLEFIESKAKGTWSLIINEVEQHRLDFGDLKHGTGIIIENLDRIVPKANTNPLKAKNNFYSLIETVSKHLGMIFHRFIEDNSLVIKINKTIVKPWNPFCLSNSATQELAEEVYYENGKEITIQPYVLPHKTKFKSEEDLRNIDGPYGINSHQGIYVYRNRRLLVYGTWFSYIRKEPAFNLARIKLDINSDSDFDWKIDIKKSAATPPLYIREILNRTIDNCTEVSAKVYNSRGTYSKNIISPNLDYVWEQRKNRNGFYSFHINKKHPILIEIEKTLDKQGQQDLIAFLSLVENFAPFMQSGIVDHLHSIDGEAVKQSDDLQRQLDIAEIKGYIKSFTSKGYDKNEIKPVILGMSNFKYIEAEILQLLEDEEND